MHIVMATSEKNSVFVELYDLTITNREDDRFGRVVSTALFTERDLINIAVSERTDLNAVTMQAALDILRTIAKEKITSGASVLFGLSYYRLGVSGVFIGDHASWDASKHKLAVHVSPTAELREAIKSTHVQVRRMAATGCVINTLTDVYSGEVNNRLTPGGGVNLTGTKIKLAGEHGDVGISLIHQANHQVTAIPKTSIALNNPSNVTFIVPPALSAGDYKLSICTQYAPSGVLLKIPRTYVFDYLLNVL